MTSAAASLAMLERRQQVLANNLANVNTSGFKRELVFAQLVGDAVAATDTRVDLAPGTLSESGNPLDLAIEDRGFFVIRTPEGERHIRGGSFRLDAEGRLVDQSGNALLGEGGDIMLNPKAGARIDIDAAGRVAVDGKTVSQLRIEAIADDASPQHEGGVRFIPHASRTPVPPAERRVKQGFTEESNVNPMDAMTQMLQVLHRFGAAQKTISTLDAVRGIAVNDLGKPV